MAKPKYHYDEKIYVQIERMILVSLCMVVLLVAACLDWG